MWARRLVNTPVRHALLRPRVMPLKAFQPLRTMATAVQQDTAEFIRTTITEDKDFGGKCLLNLDPFLKN
jgi:hypothetical protein